ncbi:zf-HC2 domain-containing protein [Kineococcus sp. LSe6-4]|uniref:Zf-HC2 domain-containing protein n=1 Tax=Kineococcus halophytocola TaxID=3234027 RepID=A0ABV4H1V2_9ACTN
MSGPHLGVRVSALVDGRLAADARARADEHVRTCPDCSEALEAERLVRARVRALGEPEPSQDLLVRLLQIGGPCGPLPPRDAPMANPARPAVGTAPPSRTDPGRSRASRGPAGRGRRRRPVAVALAGTFSLLGAGIAGVLVLGGLPGGGQAPVAELRTTPSSAPVLTTPVSSPGPSSTATADRTRPGGPAAPTTGPAPTAP